MDINNEQFINYLRSALHHLYDADQLRHNPLTILFGLNGRIDASSALQKILLDAIEGLKPGDEEPEQSSRWQIYSLLFFRYVRGYSREAVASQLGISDRQLSREQRSAIESLALYLWQINPFESSEKDLTTAGQFGPAVSAPSTFTEDVESSWIENLPAEKPSIWKSVLLSVLDLLQPLIHENNVHLNYDPDEDLPNLLIPQYTLRHSLLNILGLMIPLSKNNALVLKPGIIHQMLQIQAEIPARMLIKQTDSTAFDLHPSIEMARRLIEKAGGSLRLSSGEFKTEVCFTIPTLAQIPVLVIDDNPDTIQLFQRYAQGSRYSVVGIQEPAETIRLVDQIRPRVIVMDVMMPELDGWDLLTHLRQDQQIRDAAILICSILPQEVLARSLGADGFLQKPVLPQDFLTALDRLIDPPPNET